MQLECNQRWDSLGSSMSEMERVSIGPLRDGSPTKVRQDTHYAVTPLLLPYHEILVLFDPF